MACGSDRGPELHTCSIFFVQGTKACLGWERAPDGSLHACTAVVDSWLRLLQRALHAVRALRVAVPAAPEYMTLG